MSAKPLRRRPIALIAGLLALFATFSTAPAARALELLQGAFVQGTERYEYAYRSIPSIPVVGAPADADWSRWAMLHDGQVYRLYAFKAGTRDTLYQFGFNRGSNTYEWGHQSIPVLRISGIPSGASTRSFAMLHDGDVYRLYLQDDRDPGLLYQFGFNRATEDYEFGYRSIPRLRVTGFPGDTDWGRWAMLHDGVDYRFYAFRAGSATEVYQAAFHAGSQEYRFAWRSIPVLSMLGFPGYANRSSMAMLHDGTDYRFYFKNQ